MIMLRLLIRHKGKNTMKLQPDYGLAGFFTPEMYYRFRCVLLLLTLLWFSLLVSGCSSVADATDKQVFEQVGQKAQQRYGSRAEKVVADWERALARIEHQSEREKLHSVNNYVNQHIFFAPDIRVWGKKDYWATPVEALIVGSGDCEDFAITKYFSLKYVGVPSSKLRITYVRARIGGGAPQAHMVLAYYSTPNAEPLILDNLVKEIRPGSKRRDLQPIFSFNSEGTWTGKQPVKGKKHVSRWINLVAKMEREGFFR